MTSYAQRSAPHSGSGPADDDHVEPGASHEEPAALLVEPPRLVVAEEAVGERAQRPHDRVPNRLRIRARDGEGDPAVDEGEEEVVVLPALEEILGGPFPGHAPGQREERRATLLEEAAQGPLLALFRFRALEEDAAGLHQARVASSRFMAH